MIVPDVTDSPGVVTVLDLEDTTMLITAALMTLITSTPTLDPSTDLLWYNRPAATWTEALALGNGRLGAMVFGGLQSDRIALNESTVWTGGPYDPKGDGVGANALPEIQRLVFAGKGPEAEALFEKEMMSKTGEMAAYQPLGDLLLTFPDHAFATHYRRNLDLTTAISRVSYESKGVHYRREVICSYPDQVIALHLTADKPGALNFSATLDGRTNVKEPNDATYRISSQAPGTIILRGNTASYGGGHGLVYEARLRVVTEGGSARIFTWLPGRTSRVGRNWEPTQPRRTRRGWNTSSQRVTPAFSPTTSPTTERFMKGRTSISAIRLRAYAQRTRGSPHFRLATTPPYLPCFSTLAVTCSFPLPAKVANHRICRGCGMQIWSRRGAVSSQRTSTRR